VVGLRHASTVLPPGKKLSNIYCAAVWVGPSAGVDGCTEGLAPTGIRSRDRPPRSESLYRLRYPGPIYLSLRFSILTRYRKRRHTFCLQ
jgi:hypothetical protein